MRVKLFSLLFFIVSSVFGQENTSELSKNSAEMHSMKGAHRLTLGLGHTHISRGIVDGETEWITAGSWTLNYDYWISDRWALGLQNDVVLETFLVEDKENEIIERAYPWAIVPVAIYKAGKRLSLLGGIGVEIAHEKSLTLTRLGFEYGFHLPKHFEAGIAVVWDNKWNYYNSWGLAFTVSKIWQ
jgi:hypothetical protein